MVRYPVSEKEKRKEKKGQVTKGSWPLTIDSLQTELNLQHLLVNVLGKVPPAHPAEHVQHDVLQDDALHEIGARVAVQQQAERVVAGLRLVAELADKADVLPQVALAGLDVALPVGADVGQVVEVSRAEAVDQRE